MKRRRHTARHAAIGLLLTLTMALAAFATLPLTGGQAGETATDTALAQARPTTFRVRIDNVSDRSALPGPLSPGAWALHSTPAPFFNENVADRGDGLAAIAEDGDPAPLAASLATQEGIGGSGVFNTPVGAAGPGPLFPGQSYEFTFTTTFENRFLSLATMLVQSNDVFISPNGQGIRLFDDNNMPVPARDVTAELEYWDVGSEVNEAPEMGPNQAPRQPAADTGPAEGVISLFSNTTRSLPLASGIANVGVTQDGGEFTITIENVSATRGALETPLAPVFYALHNSNWSLFTNGQPAPANGLELLAEDGSPMGLLDFYNAGQPDIGLAGAQNTPMGGQPGPAMPGQSYQFSVTPTPDHPYLSIATMVVETNDVFLGFSGMGIPLLNPLGQPRSVEDIRADIRRELATWDAGTEANEVPGAGNNQAPRQAGPNTGPADPVNTVRRYADSTNDLAGAQGGGFSLLSVVPLTDTQIYAPLSFGVTLSNTSGMTAYPGILTPVAWAVHSDTVSLFNVGQPASIGLERVAEDGATDTLVQELDVANNPGIVRAGVRNVPVGAINPGPIMPGQAYSFVVTADPAHPYLSLATMAVPSNDTFMAFFPAGLRLLNENGMHRTAEELAADINNPQSGFVAWDAGTERNQAGAAGPDQAPRQAGPNTGANEGGGLVRMLTNPDPVWSYPPASDVLRVTVIPEVASTGPGAVFAATNYPMGNEVVMYDRAPDGRLAYIDRYATNGMGVGKGLVAPPDPLGSQDSLIVHEDWLFVVNAGSNEVSSFRIGRNGLQLASTVNSGGEYPVGLTAYGNWLYVLNAGGQANITGFTIGQDGSLTPLDGSTRTIGTAGTNPPNILMSPGQVGFTPRGNMLVVTEKMGSDRILVFPVNAMGMPAAEPQVNPSAGTFPFSFTFAGNDVLLVTEVIGQGDEPPGNGAVSSYHINSDGTLRVISQSVPNNQTATCWIVHVGGYAYVSNTASNTISSYRVANNGSLTLLEEIAFNRGEGQGPTDMAWSENYLYVLNGLPGVVTSYAISPTTGLVTSLNNPVNTLAMAPGPQGLATYRFDRTEPMTGTESAVDLAQNTTVRVADTDILGGVAVTATVRADTTITDTNGMTLSVNLRLRMTAVASNTVTTGPSNPLNRYFRLELLDGATLQPIENATFTPPIEVVATYSDADLGGASEENLALVFLDDDGMWQNTGITVVSRDPANNRITLRVSHLTLFGFSAAPAAGATVYLPVILR